mgnify:FL=1
MNVSERRKKVLIIKLGHSETLDAEISRKSSLGDVLRTTVILHALKNDDVAWLVDESAYPLLEGNPYISRILAYDTSAALQLQEEIFDTVINFEKVPGICALADRVDAWKKYGFRFDRQTGRAEAHDGAEEVLSMCLNVNEKKGGNIYWQEALLGMIGETWQKEEYILGYKPKSKEIYDIGFNYDVGKKWPNKSWPIKNWKELEALIGGKYSVSWQQGLKNIEDYIDWINSCRLLLTNDSLGLHIALALKKKVVALFGPTAHKEVYLYGRGASILPNGDYKCLPCLSPKCVNDVFCMDNITIKQVFNATEKLLKEEVKT